MSYFNFVIPLNVVPCMDYFNVVVPFNFTCCSYGNVHYFGGNRDKNNDFKKHLQLQVIYLDELIGLT